MAPLKPIATELAEVMREQFRVWEGYDEVEDALIDTCHALANMLELAAPSPERTEFMQACGAKSYGTVP